MVKRVSLFQANDGTNFSSEKEAKDYEAQSAAKLAIQYLLKKLKKDNSVITVGEGEDIFLEAFLVDNRETLLLALNGNAVKVKKERVPRKAKTAVPVTPSREEVTLEPEVTPAPGATDLDTLVAELTEKQA